MKAYQLAKAKKSLIKNMRLCVHPPPPKDILPLWANRKKVKFLGFLSPGTYLKKKKDKCGPGYRLSRDYPGLDPGHS